MTHCDQKIKNKKETGSILHPNVRVQDKSGGAKLEFTKNLQFFFKIFGG